MERLLVPGCNDGHARPFIALDRGWRIVEEILNKLYMEFEAESGMVLVMGNFMYKSFQNGSFKSAWRSVCDNMHTVIHIPMSVNNGESETHVLMGD